MYGWEHLVVNLETDLLRIKRHTLIFSYYNTSKNHFEGKGDNSKGNTVHYTLYTVYRYEKSRCCTEENPV